jgi:hypothetical protein
VCKSIAAPCSSAEACLKFFEGLDIHIVWKAKRYRNLETPSLERKKTQKARSQSELVAGVGEHGGKAVGRAGVHPAGRREVDEHPHWALRPRHQLLHKTHRG